MKRAIVLVVFAGLALTDWGGVVNAAYYRGHYTSWRYYPGRGYYWSQYNYRVRGGNYSYHYATYYRKRPNYVYYYNPYRKVYWGRYDIAKKGYSELKEEDRREDLKDIPESAFPKPGEMPKIPDAEDASGQMDPPPSKLPDRDPEDKD